MIRRKPNGQYVEPWFAIDAWFPVLMNQARQSTVFQVVMTALALFCVRQAQDEYRQASAALSNLDHSAGTGYPTRKHENALNWFRKRDILVKALKEIEEIK